MRLLWMQAGACSGDTMSLLCGNHPSMEELVDEGLDLLWYQRSKISEWRLYAASVRCTGALGNL